MVGAGTLRGGDWRPSWWGPLDILPQISIFNPPKNMKINPGPFQTKSICLKQKIIIVSGTVPLRLDLNTKSFPTWSDADDCFEFQQTQRGRKVVSENHLKDSRRLISKFRLLFFLKHFLHFLSPSN